MQDQNRQLRKRKGKATSGRRISVFQRIGRHPYSPPNSSLCNRVAPGPSSSINFSLPVQGVFMTKSAKKNARRKKAIAKARDNPVPLRKVYLSIFISEVLPTGDSPLTLPFSTLMPNAKLFFCEPNCPTACVDDVLDSKGEFKATFITSCVNYIEGSGHIEYVRGRDTNNGFALITGLFKYVPWKVNQVHPEDAVAWIAGQTTRQAQNMETMRNIIRKQKDLEKRRIGTTQSVAVALNVGTDDPSVALNVGTEVAAIPYHLRPHVAARKKAEAVIESQAKAREDGIREFERNRSARLVAEAVQQERRAAAKAREDALRAQQRPRVPTTTIANFMPPEGLEQVVRQVGVSHAYVHPYLLAKKYDSQRHVVVIDFEAHNHNIPLELAVVVINDRYEVVGEYCRTCMLASSHGSFAQGLVGFALPMVPKGLKGKDMRHANAVQDVTKAEYNSVRQSFLAFLQLCLGAKYVHASIFAKGMAVEVSCLKYLGFNDLAARVKDMCPQGYPGMYPFGLAAGPPNDWLKHGADQRIAGICIAHTGMGAGGYSLHHCALEDCRSYALALKQFSQKASNPAQLVKLMALNVGTATTNAVSASSRPRLGFGEGYTKRTGVEVIPHDNSKPCATFDALCDKNGRAIEDKRLNPQLLWVPVTKDYSNTATVCDMTQRQTEMFRGTRVDCIRLDALVEEQGPAFASRFGDCVPPNVLLGQGSYGVVLVCFMVSRGVSNEVVLKVSKGGHFRRTEVRASVLADHTNINLCLGHSSYEHSHSKEAMNVLVLAKMDMCLFKFGVQSSSAVKAVRPFQDFPMNDVLAVIHSVEAALTYLHNVLRLVHLDLHEANVLVNFDSERHITHVCLGDMGMVRPFTVGNVSHIDSHKGKKRLPHYAEECYDNNSVGEHTDVYGYIVLCIHVMCGTHDWKQYFTKNRDFSQKIEVESLLQLRRNVVRRGRPDRPPGLSYRRFSRQIYHALNGDMYLRKTLTLQKIRHALAYIVADWFK